MTSWLHVIASYHCVIISLCHCVVVSFCCCCVIVSSCHAVIVSPFCGVILWVVESLYHRVVLWSYYRLYHCVIVWQCHCIIVPPDRCCWWATVWSLPSQAKSTIPNHILCTQTAGDDNEWLLRWCDDDDNGDDENNEMTMTMVTRKTRMMTIIMVTRKTKMMTMTFVTKKMMTMVTRKTKMMTILQLATVGTGGHMVGGSGNKQQFCTNFDFSAQFFICKNWSSAWVKRLRGLETTLNIQLCLELYINIFWSKDPLQ